MGLSLPSPNEFKKNPFACSKKHSANNKRQSIRAAVQIAKAPLPNLSKVYFPAMCFQHCFPTYTSVTPIYFENKLIKTAYLLYFDWPISSLTKISELQLEVLFDLSHRANARDICEHSCVRQRGKDTQADQHVSTGISLLMEVQLYWQNYFSGF